MEVNKNTFERYGENYEKIEPNENFYGVNNDLIFNAESLALAGPLRNKYKIENCEVNGTYYFVRKIFNICGQAFYDYLKTTHSDQKMSEASPELIFNQKECTPPELQEVRQECNFTDLKNNECKNELITTISQYNNTKNEDGTSLNAETLEEFTEIWIQKFCLNNWMSTDVGFINILPVICALSIIIAGGCIYYNCSKKKHTEIFYNPTAQEEIEIETEEPSNESINLNDFKPQTPALVQHTEPTNNAVYLSSFAAPPALTGEQLDAN